MEVKEKKIEKDLNILKRQTETETENRKLKTETEN